MNRRAFLIGLVATSAIAACPMAIEAALTTAPAIDYKAYFEQWMKDAAAELAMVWEDQIIFGVGAYEHTGAYPFVRRIDPATLSAPAHRGGLFND